jgi:hypothetical protein
MAREPRCPGAAWQISSVWRAMAWARRPSLPMVPPFCESDTMGETGGGEESASNKWGTDRAPSSLAEQCSESGIRGCNRHSRVWTTSNVPESDDAGSAQVGGSCHGGPVRRRYIGTPAPTGPAPHKEAVMAEVKIKPGSLTIEIVDQGKVVAKLDYPLTLTKVRLEPKDPKDPRYGPARDIWTPEPAPV